MTDKRLCIAQIATAHGIKGFVRLKLYTDNIDHFGEMQEFKTFKIDETSDKSLSIRLKNPIKEQWLAEVKGVSDRNAAEELRGTKIYINETDLKPLDGEEFYYKDLVGLKVIDSADKMIGHVSSVDNFGAGDLLEIRQLNGSSFYLPFKDETVANVDIQAETIAIQNYDGFIII